MHNLCIDFIFISSNVHLKEQSVDLDIRASIKILYIYIYI